MKLPDHGLQEFLEGRRGVLLSDIGVVWSMCICAQPLQDEEVVRVLIVVVAASTLKKGSAPTLRVYECSAERGGQVTCEEVCCRLSVSPCFLPTSVNDVSSTKLGPSVLVAEVRPLVFTL